MPKEDEINPKENWCIKEEDWLRLKANPSHSDDLLDMIQAGELVLISDSDETIIATLGIGEDGKLKKVEIK